MEDCVFLLADGQMKDVFEGFLRSDNFHRKLGTRYFTTHCHPDTQGRDPGVFTRGHETLRIYCRTHTHAIAVLDRSWDGAPQTEVIRTTLRNNLTRNGWREDSVEVIVIEPELETWLWQEPHTTNILQFDYHPHPSLASWLEHNGLLISAELKPLQPKEAFELLCKEARVPRSGSLYSKIAQKVSVSRCTDPAFRLLCTTLQRWFSSDGGQV